MTVPADPADQADQADQDKREMAEVKAERRGILASLRNIGKDIQTVERRVIDDYARADQERRG